MVATATTILGADIRVRRNGCQSVVGWRRARGGLLAVLALVPLLRALLERLARAVAIAALVAPSAAAPHPASEEGDAEQPEQAEHDQQEPEQAEDSEAGAEEVRAVVVGRRGAALRGCG